MKTNQNGFAHLYLIIMFILVVSAVGFTATRVMRNHEPPVTSGRIEKVEGTKQVADRNTPGLLTSSQGAFKEMPFKVDEVSLVTLGKETNDARFVYPWVKSVSTKIYAPADGILYKIRHKVYEIGGKKGNDYDIFFQVSKDTAYRFNHISNPRSDIKATYSAGELPSGDYANGGMDIEERVKPSKAIAVKAGEDLGSTVGTPEARNFDFAVGTVGSNPNAREGELFSVCPFSVFNEPMKTNLLNMLGPKGGVPQPGYPCDIASQKF